MAKLKGFPETGWTYCQIASLPAIPWVCPDDLEWAQSQSPDDYVPIKGKIVNRGRVAGIQELLGRWAKVQTSSVAHMEILQKQPQLVLRTGHGQPFLFEPCF